MADTPWILSWFSKYFILLSLCVISILIKESHCSNGKNKLCDVCRIVVSEAEWAISQVDQSKSISVGSFRVDPKGNQPYKKEKKFARSESHLEDVFEKICDKFQEYAAVTSDKGEKIVVRTIGFGGKQLNTKDLDLDREYTKALKYRCEDFLEDNVDTVIGLLQKENIPSYEKLICGEETDVCTADALAKSFMTLPELLPELEEEKPEGSVYEDPDEEDDPMVPADDVEGKDQDSSEGKEEL